MVIMHTYTGIHSRYVDILYMITVLKVVFRLYDTLRYEDNPNIGQDCGSMEIW